MSQKKRKTDRDVHVECPVCKGAGTLPRPLKKIQLARKDAVQALLDAGFSYREVASLLGYRSPGSVLAALKVKE